MNQYFHRVPYAHPLFLSLITKLKHAHRLRVHVFFEASAEHGSIIIVQLLLNKIEFDHHPRCALLELPLLYLWLPGNESLI